MVHAGVHREDEAAALRSDMVGQTVELAEGRARLVAQEEADVIGGGIEAADEVGHRFETDRLTRAFGLCGAARKQEAAKGEKGGAQQHWLQVSHTAARPQPCRLQQVVGRR